MALGHFFRWVRDNLSISLSMVLMTAAVVGVYQATEIDGREYRTLSTTFVYGTDRYRARLADEAGRGEISKWLFKDLVRDFWTDASGLTVQTTEATDLNTEKEAFRAAVAGNVRATREN